MSQYDDAYIHWATPKQHLKLKSWKIQAPMRLSWKKACMLTKWIKTRLNCANWKHKRNRFYSTVVNSHTQAWNSSIYCYCIDNHVFVIACFYFFQKKKTTFKKTLSNTLFPVKQKDSHKCENALGSNLNILRNI